MCVVGSLSARLDDLPVGDAIRVDFDGKAYAVYHTQSGFYATEGPVHA